MADDKPADSWRKSRATHLVTFESTHAAMTGQDALGALMPEILPVPREIHSSCGIAMRFAAPQNPQGTSDSDNAVLVQVDELLGQADIPRDMYRVYALTEQAGKTGYRPLER